MLQGLQQSPKDSPLIAAKRSGLLRELQFRFGHRNSLLLVDLNAHVGQVGIYTHLLNRRKKCHNRDEQAAVAPAFCTEVSKPCLCLLVAPRPRDRSINLLEVWLTPKRHVQQTRKKNSRTCSRVFALYSSKRQCTQQDTQHFLRCRNEPDVQLAGYAAC